MHEMTVPLNDELEQLVTEYTGPLLRGAQALGFSTSDAEELVQDTFVDFLKARERFEGRSTVKTFLFGILHNKGAALWRERKREVGVEDIEAIYDAQFDAAGHWRASMPQGPEEAILSKEIGELIASCAKGLSVAQRTAFFLKSAEGASSEEICNVLGVTDTNLRVLLFRARLRLRECLEKNWKTR